MNGKPDDFPLSDELIKLQKLFTPWEKEKNLNKKKKKESTQLMQLLY